MDREGKGIPPQSQGEQNKHWLIITSPIQVIDGLRTKTWVCLPFNSFNNSSKGMFTNCIPA